MAPKDLIGFVSSHFFLRKDNHTNDVKNPLSSIVLQFVNTAALPLLGFISLFSLPSPLHRSLCFGDFFLPICHLPHKGRGKGKRRLSSNCLIERAMLVLIHL